MAKKTVAKRRAVPMETLEDLRAWLQTHAFPGWDLTLSCYLSDRVHDGSRNNHSSYSLSLKIPQLQIDIDLNAGTPADLAMRFQNQGWPQIQRAVQDKVDRARRPKIETPPMRRLTNSPDPVLFR
jgi:hypothetical protein